jgi:hypothetical protein
LFAQSTHRGADVLERFLRLHFDSLHVSRL